MHQIPVLLKFLQRLNNVLNNKNNNGFKPLKILQNLKIKDIIVYSLYLLIVCFFISKNCMN
jgi:hypothetical protein